MVTLMPAYTMLQQALNSRRASRLQIQAIVDDLDRRLVKMRTPGRAQSHRWNQTRAAQKRLEYVLDFPFTDPSLYLEDALRCLKRAMNTKSAKEAEKSRTARKRREAVASVIQTLRDLPDNPDSSQVGHVTRALFSLTQAPGKPPTCVNRKPGSPVLRRVQKMLGKRRYNVSPDLVEEVIRLLEPWA